MPGPGTLLSIFKLPALANIHAASRHLKWPVHKPRSRYQDDVAGQAQQKTNEWEVLFSFIPRRNRERLFPKTLMRR